MPPCSTRRSLAVVPDAPAPPPTFYFDRLGAYADFADRFPDAPPRAAFDAACDLLADACNAACTAWAARYERKNAECAALRGRLADALRAADDAAGLPAGAIAAVS